LGPFETRQQQDKSRNFLRGSSQPSGLTAEDDECGFFFLTILIINRLLTQRNAFSKEKQYF
jgi:hypothetical protein